MKFDQQKFFPLNGKEKPPGSFQFFQKIKSIGLPERMGTFLQKSDDFLGDIKSIGFTKNMDDYDKRKLSIFNQVNFFQLVTGIIVPLCCLVTNVKFPVSLFLIASLPSFVSVLVLSLNFYYKYEAGIICYFILSPLVASIVYLNGMNMGIELFFVLYAILSVFFLQEISQMIFSVSLSMISYFMLSVAKNSQYHLGTSHPALYLFNQVIAIILIFYGLFLIKRENTGYQSSILTKNAALFKKNQEIQKQKEEITKNEKLLKVQTVELTELNSLKNKLFSVIAHDLKAPMYALRNLFQSMLKNNLPASEIKKILPDVVNDLTYTTGLMENLLLWAKNQMQNGAGKTQIIDVEELVTEVVHMLELQADAKQIKISNLIDEPISVLSDKDMVNLVLRNLVSNAIKFTPERGTVSISALETPGFLEIFIQDTGIGISPEAIAKISQNDYYTTRGTSSESGTGLGLMLCKEFLTKNGGQLHIESEEGRGSTFTFRLPKCHG
jgi:two-component system sensor histidine kinase/response regulator